ncbi:hypothetical protein Tcan_16834 [Toxocara canis]|uniref:Uncharacterized protein n=1 Tax=Toxocara canis TaxID=6265 RepID=A0A0B2V8L1_TOXCA|nr:hypothetical protein Tcan_16834 [Toxocara canis]
MSEKGSVPQSSIEWHDSPKFVVDKTGGLRSKAPHIKRNESEQKFNTEFEKWFTNEDGNIGAHFSYSSDELQDDRMDVTPPVLRARCDAVRPFVRAYTPTKALDNVSVAEGGSVLAESIREGKESIKKMIKKRRLSDPSSLRSLNERLAHDNSSMDHRSAAAVNRATDQTGKNEMASGCIEGSLWTVSELKRNGDVIGPSTSTQMVTPPSTCVSRQIIRFEEDGVQEPSPIAPTGSTKRTRFGLIKGDNRDGHTSSEEENMGTVENRHFRSHRTSTVFDIKQVRVPSSSTPICDEKEGCDNDSMDDEMLNMFLSQIPIESPRSRPSGTEISAASETKTLRESVGTSNPSEAALQCATARSGRATVKRKVCVVKKMSSKEEASNERTPFRRWRTCEISASRVTVGGWGRRISMLTGGNDLVGEKNKAEIGSSKNDDKDLTEAMPRSASFEPQKSDSFWDDSEFEGIDFKAIDAVK